MVSLMSQFSFRGTTKREGGGAQADVVCHKPVDFAGQKHPWLLNPGGVIRRRLKQGLMVTLGGITTRTTTIHRGRMLHSRPSTTANLLHIDVGQHIGRPGCRVLLKRSRLPKPYSLVKLPGSSCRQDSCTIGCRSTEDSYRGGDSRIAIVERQECRCNGSHSRCPRDHTIHSHHSHFVGHSHTQDLPIRTKCSHSWLCHLLMAPRIPYSGAICVTVDGRVRLGSNLPKSGGHRQRSYC